MFVVTDEAGTVVVVPVTATAPTDTVNPVMLISLKSSGVIALHFPVELLTPVASLSHRYPIDTLCVVGGAVKNLLAGVGV